MTCDDLAMKICNEIERLKNRNVIAVRRIGIKDMGKVSLFSRLFSMINNTKVCFYFSLKFKTNLIENLS